MTDLGSVIFEAEKQSNPENVGDNTVPVPTHNHRASHRTTTMKNRPPSPILEAPENNMTDSGIDEISGHQLKDNEKEIGTQQVTGNGGVNVIKQEVKKSSSNCDIVINHRLSGSSEQDYSSDNRNSLCSEQDFGSCDLLTENDSLENVDKAGFTNVIAEVDVHVHREDDADMETRDNKRGSHSKQCNGNKEQTTSVDGSSNSKDDAHLSETSINPATELKSEGRKVKANLDNDTDTIEVDEIAFADDEVDVENIEKQIITNSVDISDYGERVQTHNVAQNDQSVSKSDDLKKDNIEELNTCVDSTLSNGAQNMDCNKNETKASVRFREEIQEERIIPKESVPIEGTPRQKKDASSRRETWASRKLKQTFRLKDKEKYEEEDHECRGGCLSFLIQVLM